MSTSTIITRATAGPAPLLAVSLQMTFLITVITFFALNLGSLFFAFTPFARLFLLIFGLFLVTGIFSWFYISPIFVAPL